MLIFRWFFYIGSGKYGNWPIVFNVLNNSKSYSRNNSKGKKSAIKDRSNPRDKTCYVFGL